jgi:hypothetical protein
MVRREPNNTPTYHVTWDGNNRVLVDEWYEEVEEEPVDAKIISMMSV